MEGEIDVIIDRNGDDNPVQCQLRDLYSSFPIVQSSKYTKMNQKHLSHQVGTLTGVGRIFIFINAIFLHLNPLHGIFS